MRHTSTNQPASKTAFILVATAVIAFGCVTINVYFPEEAIKDLSERIEDEVERVAGAGTASFRHQQALDGQRSLWAYVAEPLLRLTAGQAYAQGDAVAAPEVTNPAIRKIIDSRAARLAELNRFKASGAIGETNKGDVAVRNLDSLDLRDRAAVQRLVKSENKDRDALYKEIAAAKSVDLSQAPRIRATYAATLREKAKPGDWIQMPDGTWRQK